MKKQNINFFLHYKRAFTLLENDTRIRANHMSTYMVLFRMWNNTMFSHRMQILRENIMTTAKIGNKGTYTNALQDLHYWGYIKYIFDPIQRRSYVEMIRFDDEDNSPNNNPKIRPNKLQSTKPKTDTKKIKSVTAKVKSGTEELDKNGSESVPELEPIIKKETFIEDHFKKTSSEVTNKSFKKTEEYFGNDLGKKQNHTA